MASENETFDMVIMEVKRILDAIEQNCDGQKSTWRGVFDRIEAAHEREVAELRECLKDACNTELSCNECKSPCSEYTQDDCPIKKRWRKALEGMENAK